MAMIETPTLQFEQLKMHGRMLVEVRDAVTGELKDYQEINNLVCNIGKNMIAARLNGETVTTTGIINYLGVGTGANIPSASDTQLQTEIARTTVSTNSRTNNVVTITFFFGSGSANGALREAAAFIDGTGTANSGNIFDRVNLNVTKTSADTLTITLIVTIT